MNEDICWKYKKNEIVFETPQAIAFFLKEEVLMINSNWFEKSWNKRQQQTYSVSVLCNDVFLWGCADAESIAFNEIDTLWQFYCKDPVWGPAMWCITKTKTMPQRPVYDDIMKQGIWNLDTMGLKPGADNIVPKSKIVESDPSPRKPLQPKNKPKKPKDLSAGLAAYSWRVT